MVQRELWLAMTRAPIRSRRDASKFENGRNNISSRVSRLGLRVVVVGRNGRVFDAADWPCSGTFWQEEQHNLLVEDNQTRKYSLADQRQRDALERTAWGPR